MSSTIFCIWFGSAPMSPTRAAQLDQLRQGTGCEVELVHEDNLGDYVSSTRPLHPGFEFLTVMHQADYLRAYLMAVHGGGYSDIKAPGGSWVPAFRILEQRSDIDVVGYGITHRSHAARLGLPARWKVGGRRVSPSLMFWNPGWRRHLRYRLAWKRLIGPSAFIMRRGSVFASEYLGAIEDALDASLPELSRGAALFPDGTRRLGKETYYGLDGYPFRWIALANDVLHPLCLRHSGRVDYSLPPPNLVEYR